MSDGHGNDLHRDADPTQPSRRATNERIVVLAKRGSYSACATATGVRGCATQSFEHKAKSRRG
jgi:hypothetical protein